MEALIFEEGNLKKLDEAVKPKMVGPIEHFEKELAKTRTGRASAAMVEDIEVEAYGQKMRIRELATISVPEPRLITLHVWDKSLIPAVEKAIQASDLGVTPFDDGEIIRIQLPQITHERREELGRHIRKKAEEARVAIRNIRKEFHNRIREAEKEGLISEDFAVRLSKHLQEITDEYIGKIDKMLEKKLEELHLL